MRASAPWIAAGVGLAVGLLVPLLVRLPLPFPGFSAVVAAFLALLVTFALLFAMPQRWLHTDDALLAHAFQARHGVSAQGANNALEAIQRAHRIASSLRSLSGNFIEALRAKAENAADLLDDAARKIFYEPRTLRQLQPALVRSEMIEELVQDHAKLRAMLDEKASGEETAQASRERVGAALDALDTAMRSIDQAEADRILQRVEASSATAERLLAPRARPYT